MNKVILIGNLTKDPELSTTNTGISVCKFSIAVNRNFKNANGEMEVDFFNIVVWRAQAENAGKFLRKGSKVGVVGSIQNRSYEDQNGNKRFVTDIVAENVEFLSPKSDTNNGSSNGGSGRNAEADLESIDDDSLPF